MSSRSSSSSSAFKRACVSAPTPGGEPLWHISRHPSQFRLIIGPAETYENRRLPGTSHRFAALWSGYKRIEAIGTCIALGNSREPPVATFFGRMKHSNEYCEVIRYAPKRLPSRRCPFTHRINSATYCRGRDRSASLYPGVRRIGKRMFGRIIASD